LRNLFQKQALKGFAERGNGEGFGFNLREAAGDLFRMMCIRKADDRPASGTQVNRPAIP